MADTLASPLAFELCEGGTCVDPKHDNAKPDAHIECPRSDNCSKGDCYCQLFRRKKGSADTVPWRVARAGYDRTVKYEPDEFDYKCLCVKPILEVEHTTDGEKYATRYVLCGLGACGLQSPDDPFKKEYKCSGNCERECKCTLFRLQIEHLFRGDTFKPELAKWEYVAKADKFVEWDGHYFYRCFCLKPS